MAREAQKSPTQEERTDKAIALLTIACFMRDYRITLEDIRELIDDPDYPKQGMTKS